MNQLNGQKDDVSCLARNQCTPALHESVSIHETCAKSQQTSKKL